MTQICREYQSVHANYQMGITIPVTDGDRIRVVHVSHYKVKYVPNAKVLKYKISYVLPRESGSDECITVFASKYEVHELHHLIQNPDDNELEVEEEVNDESVNYKLRYEKLLENLKKISDFQL